MRRSHNQQLVDVFLQHLNPSAVVIDLYDTLPNLKQLIDAYNHYAVRNGNVPAIDPDQTTVGNLKHLLEGLPPDYLRTVLFAFSNTDEDVTKMARADRKESFKYRMITLGFLLVAVAVCFILVITLVQSVQNGGEVQGDLMSEVVKISIELFKIITKL